MGELSHIFDLTLVLNNGISKELLITNKSILSSKSLYFKSMFNNFKEKTESRIIINVDNLQVSYYVINNLFQNETKYLSSWKNILDQYVFMDFLLVKKELPSKIQVPKNDFDSFLDMIEKIGYTKQTLELILQNIPNDYNFNYFPKDFLKEIYEITTCVYVIHHNKKQLIINNNSKIIDYKKEINDEIITVTYSLTLNELIFNTSKKIYSLNINSDEYREIISFDEIIDGFLITSKHIIIWFRYYILIYDIFNIKLINKLNVFDRVNGYNFSNKYTMINYHYTKKICCCKKWIAISYLIKNNDNENIYVVYIYDIKNNKIINKINVPFDTLNMLFSPNGRYLSLYGAVENFNEMKIFDVTHTSITCKWYLHFNAKIIGSSWNHNNDKIIVNILDESIIILNINNQNIKHFDTQQLKLKFTNEKIRILTVEFFSENLLFITYYNESLYSFSSFIINIITYELIYSFTNINDKPQCFVPLKYHHLNSKIKEALNS